MANEYIEEYADSDHRRRSYPAFISQFLFLNLPHLPCGGPLLFHDTTSCQLLLQISVESRAAQSSELRFTNCSLALIKVSASFTTFISPSWTNHLTKVWKSLLALTIYQWLTPITIIHHWLDIRGCFASPTPSNYASPHLWWSIQQSHQWHRQ